MRRADQRVARGRAGERRRRVGRADVAHQVRMQVDEPGYHGIGRPVHEVRAAARTRAPGRDRCDTAVVNANRLVVDVAALFDVEHAPRAHDDHVGGCRLRETGECKCRYRSEPPWMNLHAPPPDRGAPS